MNSNSNDRPGKTQLASVPYGVVLVRVRVREKCKGDELRRMGNQGQLCQKIRRTDNARGGIAGAPRKQHRPGGKGGARCHTSHCHCGCHWGARWFSPAPGPPPPPPVVVVVVVVAATLLLARDALRLPGRWFWSRLYLGGKSSARLAQAERRVSPPGKRSMARGEARAKQSKRAPACGAGGCLSARGRLGPGGGASHRPRFLHVCRQAEGGALTGP